MSVAFDDAIVLLGVAPLAVSVTEAWTLVYVPAADPTPAEVQLLEDPPDEQANPPEPPLTFN